ncbi:MAG TPA: DR2241 family protein [Chthoniobacterales bacterium]|jgi:sirohydrochlorin cobaltochelatase
MSGILAEKLTQWLDQGRCFLGEVQISRTEASFELRHHRDEASEALKHYHSAEDAIELGKYDPVGRYRPLRTAPNLQQGWLLSLADIHEVVRALDFFYPAMLGTARAFEENRGAPTNLRDTLNRQTGMYRVAGKITNAQADALIGEVCHPSRCIKTITWQIESAFPVSAVPAAKLDLRQDLLDRPSARGGFIPLPCEECCNILVAAARETVKKAATPASPPTT